MRITKKGFVFAALFEIRVGKREGMIKSISISDSSFSVTIPSYIL